MWELENSFHILGKLLWSLAAWNVLKETGEQEV